MTLNGTGGVASDSTPTYTVISSDVYVYGKTPAASHLGMDIIG